MALPRTHIRPSRRPRAPAALREFGQVAWTANITGLSSMLAYSMLYGVVPLSLLGLFVAGRVLSSATAQHSIELTLRDFFPGTTKHTLDSLLSQVAHSAPTTGVLALVASLWLASSFWGALDTSFSRIYGCPSRTWLAQKRFGLVMVAVMILFMLATVMVPTLQSLLKGSVEHLPFLLRHVHGAIYAVSLGFTVAVVFACLATIYSRVPNLRVPWRAVWPGALAATVGISLVAFAFPVYLGSISTIARFGTAVVFIVIVLGWFYLVALMILAGGVMNCVALRRHAPGATPD